MEFAQLDKFSSSKDKDDAVFAHCEILQKMVSPVAFTINCHPVRSFKEEDLNSGKSRWHKRSTNLEDINALWSCLSYQLYQAFTFSSYRGKTDKDIFCIGNIEIGSVSGQIHLHGIANNILDLDVRPFRYILKTAIERSSNKVRIVSGKPDLNYFADDGWVQYMFKSSFHHQLMA